MLARATNRCHPTLRIVELFTVAFPGFPRFSAAQSARPAGPLAVARSSDGERCRADLAEHSQIQNTMPPAAMQSAEPVTESNGALGKIGLGTCTDRAAQDAGPLGEYEAERTAR